MKIFDTSRTRYISHRGFRPLAPDNSLPGFEYAGILKQWAIETDVHITADGVAVCIHNSTVDETFDGTGNVRDMTWKELSALHMNCGNRLECFTDEQKRIPLFCEYLAICKKYGCIPFIETKTNDAEIVINEIHKAGLGDDEVVISSTDILHLEAVRQHTKSIFIHWIFAAESEIERFAKLGNAGISWNIPDCFSCPEEKINLVHGMGLKVCLRAGDNVEQVKHMQNLGLDYIPTNCMHDI